MVDHTLFYFFGLDFVKQGNTSSCYVNRIVHTRDHTQTADPVGFCKFIKSLRLIGRDCNNIKDVNLRGEEKKAILGN